MPNKLKQEDGFSLLEVLISSTILVIVAVAFGTLITNSFSVIKKTEDKAENLSNNRSQIEQELYSFIEVNNQEGIGLTDELDFKFPAVGGLDAQNIEVKGAMNTKGDLDYFLPSVPSVAQLELDPPEHDFGNEPDQIKCTIETESVPDNTNIELKFISENGNPIRHESGSIKDNQVEITIDPKTSPIPNPGFYSIDLEIGGRAANFKADYVIRPVRSVAVGDNGTILTSFRADSWGVSNLNTPNDLNAVTYGGSEDNKRFVIVGDIGTVLISEDGVHWNNETPTFQSEINGQNLNGVTWGDGKFIVVGDNGTITELNYNEATDNWSATDLSKPTITANLNDISYGGSEGQKKFVIAGDLADDNLSSLYSSDGTSWNEITSDIAPDFSSIRWVNLEADNGEEVQGFILAGAGEIKGLSEDGDSEITALSFSDDEVLREIDFNNLLVGEQTCWAVGTNADDNYEVFSYQHDTSISDWGSWEGYPNLLDGVLEWESLRIVTGAAFNNADVVFIANTNGDEGKIIYSGEQAQWTVAEIANGFDDSRLNDIITRE